MDLLNKEVTRISGELNAIGKRILNIETDILKIVDNLDFIRNQNKDILGKISKAEGKEKIPDISFTEVIENINKKLNNIEKKPIQDLESITNNLDKLSLRNTGKEKITRKLSSTFYKV